MTRRVDAQADMTAWEHLYIHVPFCDGKCRYCGLYSVVHCPAGAAAYLDALAAEMDMALADAGPMPRPQTLYVGGGTPSVLSPAHLERLCALVRQRVDLGGLSEWTVEINPGTVTDAGLGILRRAGVNRLSIGAQSFSDAALRAAGRRHSAHDTDLAVDRAHRHGFTNVGLDLIAGLPGETPESWARTLDRATGLGATHLSVYALTVERGTELERMAARRSWSPMTDSALSRTLGAAARHLRRAGFRRYEISNFSLPGNACRHNLSFWRGGDYLGFGPAAASRCGNRRWTNRADVAAYVGALADGQPPPRRTERLGACANAGERLVFGLRLNEGVNPDDLAVHAGRLARSTRARWENAAAALDACGLLRRRRGRWVLTRRGRDLADHAARVLLTSQTPAAC